MASTTAGDRQGERERALTAGETDALRFAPQILARLGEELNPNPDQGVLELVRNAYDADADRCLVELDEIAEPGGTIRVRDWGSGIDRAGISRGWLVLGRSTKTVGRRTAKGRLQVGQKGLGRLAALRQGERATLRSWPRSRKTTKTTRTEHEVVLDWADFDEAATVDEVPVPIETYEVEPMECGTEIIVSGLRRRWTRPEVKRLARALLLLGDPFGDDSGGFTVELLCPEHPDLESLVADSYFRSSTYSISANLNEDGRAELRLRDGRLGIDETADHEAISAMDPDRENAVYDTPSATFQLNGFLRSAQALQTIGSAATLQGLREWLDAYGGVHIYHRGLRVAPYGDPGSDWLDMNLLRARNPENRPSTNTAVGRVIVQDPSGRLVQKTDRSGFIEDEPFLELRRFGRDVLEWAGRRRTKVADDLRKRDQEQGPKKRDDARSALDKELGNLKPKERKAVSQAVRRFEKAAEADAEQLRKDLLLYRTLATIGTTSAQIAHETFNPALAIIDLADEIEALSRDEFAATEQAALTAPVQQIDALAKRLRDYSLLPRVLLAEPKRRIRTFRADRALADTVAVLQPLLKRHRIRIDTDLDDKAQLRGPSALLDAIISNLLINAMHALDSQNETDRTVLIRGTVENDSFVLEVADNGAGIVDLDPDEIWVPGATTTPDGTGLGLTIVQDSARQLGGRADVTAQGELGGAHFMIRLPLAG